MTSGESISAGHVAAIGEHGASAETRLIERAQRRLPDAWTQIYHENYDKLFRYALARVGHRETAEDLAATTFLEALKSIETYRHGERPLLAWLYTIARNVVNQHYRKRFRRSAGETPLAESMASAPAEPEESAMADRLDLNDAVRALPENQREVLVLHYFVGLTIPEVARLLGKHERAVYSLQTRAIKAVRRCLDEGEKRKFGDKGE